MVFKSIFFLTLLYSNLSYGQVWKNQNVWSDQWELTYSEWVEKNWTQDVFKNPNSILAGLPTVCSSASYVMRAWFSYTHKLPFAFHGVSKTGTVILTNNINFFDSVPSENERFRRFLVFMSKITNTSTLAMDTYPVSIDRINITPGTIYLSPGEHSLQIIHVKNNGNIVTLCSTTPSEARILFRSESFPFYVPKNFSSYSDGYRRFKQPQNIYLSNEKQKGYSNEQYNISRRTGDDYMAFTKELILRLAVERETADETVSRSLKNLCFFARERAYIVVQGYLKWAMNGKKCLSRSDEDGHSTYQRDRRLLNYFLYAKELITDTSFQFISNENRIKLTSVFSNEVKSNFCKVETSDGKISNLSLFNVWQIISENKLVSDPNAYINQRWGLEPFAKKCSY